jgi:hypothetical protein
MKTTTCITIVMLAFVPFNALLAAQAAVDPSGTWQREYVWNDATVEEVIRLDLEGVKVVGTLLRNDESHDIKDGTLKGDEVSFSIGDDYQGTAWTARYTGVVQGDEIRGTVVAEANGESWDFGWIVTRRIQIDPSGTWRREYDWNDARVEEVIRLNQMADGKIMGMLWYNDAALEIKDAKLKGRELSFSVSGDYQGNAWTTSYTGTMTGEEIKGTGVLQFSGESWDFDWTPLRSVQLNDLVGTWNIRIESEDGNVLEPTLKISKDGEAYRGDYKSMQGYDLDVKDLRVENNNTLRFTLAGESDGNPFKVDYQGRPYGGKISGSLEYDFGSYAGQSEFSGKRKSD